MKDEDEILDMLELARDEANSTAFEGAPSSFPGMSYEDGVVAALEWVIGETEDSPLED